VDALGVISYASKRIAGKKKNVLTTRGDGDGLCGSGLSGGWQIDHDGEHRSHTGANPEGRKVRRI